MKREKTGEALRIKNNNFQKQRQIFLFKSEQKYVRKQTQIKKVWL